MAKKLPKQIYVYQCDEVDGEPIYAVARNVEEIPEDQSGAKVSVFNFDRTVVFVVSRSVE